MKEFLQKIKNLWDSIDKPYKILIILVTLSLLSRAIVVFGG